MAQFHGTEVDVVNGGFLFVQRATTLFFRVSLPSFRWMALGEACFRLALSKPLTVALPASVLYFAESVPAHGNALPSVRKKILGKDEFAVTSLVVCGLPSVALGKPFAEWKRAFAECLGHSAKHPPVSRSGYSIIYIHLISKMPSL